MSSNLRINADRLIARMTEMAQIGATPKGGVCRVALSNEDKAGRDLFVAWCKQAGCSLRIDRIGNIFAQRPGIYAEELPVLTGSHLDSQPTGGKYDGVYGVLAALEVIETLNEASMETQHPIEIVSWTNEEGARFAPGLTGSGVYCGEFDLQDMLAITDKQGQTIGNALQSTGYAGDVKPGIQSFHAVIELHIEQGPILESEAKTIGIVEGIQGMRWYDLILTGQEAHAGSTPMENRRDPAAGTARLITQVLNLNSQYAPHGRATFGDITVEPGSRNTVPGSVKLTLDYRHPDAAVLDRVDREIRTILQVICQDLRIEGHVEDIWCMPPVTFSPVCITAVQHAADLLEYPSRVMTSGAGHDAMYLSRMAPTGMIFVPSKDGLSHNELEYTKPEDLIAGANVLLHTILNLAGSSQIDG
jgi:N-carbamoyl-L-amino-acid hydrolase